jgi:hypothetical protein
MRGLLKSLDRLGYSFLGSLDGVFVLLFLLVRRIWSSFFSSLFFFHREPPSLIECIAVSRYFRRWKFLQKKVGPSVHHQIISIRTGLSIR